MMDGVRGALGWLAGWLGGAEGLRRGSGGYDWGVPPGQATERRSQPASQHARIQPATLLTGRARPVPGPCMRQGTPHLHLHLRGPCGLPVARQRIAFLSSPSLRGGRLMRSMSGRVSTRRHMKRGMVFGKSAIALDQHQA